VWDAREEGWIHRKQKKKSLSFYKGSSRKGGLIEKMCDVVLRENPF
jgi:hypothetical protein